MKTFLRNIIMIGFIFFSVFFMTLPTKASPSIKNISLNTNNVCGINYPEQPDDENSQWIGSYVYFGKYDGNSQKFRVLNPKETAYSNDAKPTIFLDSEFFIKEMAFRSDSGYDLNKWTDSSVREWLIDETNGYLKDYSYYEKKAIISSSRQYNNKEYLDNDENMVFYACDLNNDKAFILDIAEISNQTYGYSNNINVYTSVNNRIKKGMDNKNNHYWLRSKSGDHGIYNAVIRSGSDSYHGCLGEVPSNSYALGVCPAINVDLSSIFYVSSCGTNKSNVFSSTENVNQNNEWKVTIITDDTDFAASIPPQAYIGEKVNIDVLKTVNSCIHDVEFNQTSAMLVDADGVVVAYGRIGDISVGKKTFRIPSDIATGKYSLKIFLEEINGNCDTDYVSKIVESSISIGGNNSSEENRILTRLADLEKTDPICKHNSNYWGDEGNIFEGASQCLGFVKYVTSKLFGIENVFAKGYSLIGDASCIDESALASLFMNARAGDVLLLNNDANKDGPFVHFAIFMSSDDNGIYIYEGNRGGLTKYNNFYSWDRFGEFYSTYVHLLRCNAAAAEPVGSGELKGWTQIEQACSNSSELSFYVNMNDETCVPESLFQIAKEKRIDLNLDYGTYSWSIDAESIKSAKTLDLEVKFGNNFIPNTILSQIMNPFKQLNLVYSGELGLKATLKYYIGKNYSGKKVTLYYYDESKKTLRQENKATVDSNGYVYFDFTHASSYVIDIEVDGIHTNNASEDKYLHEEADSIPKSAEEQFFDFIFISIDMAIQKGEKTVKIDGRSSGVNSLNLRTMQYAKEKGISLEFIYTYKGNNYDVLIPASKIVVDNKIPWYGPIYLFANYSSTDNCEIKPSEVGHIYIVKSGDTLGKIAKKNGIKVSRLKELNPNLFNQKYIHIGQKVVLD